jgi:hypothetical protein
LTFPSLPALAINLPTPSFGFTDTLVTGPRCERIWTAGLGRLGVQSVIQPFWWPRYETAVWVFWVMVCEGPSFVRCWEIRVPVVVSVHERWPAFV